MLIIMLAVILILIYIKLLHPILMRTMLVIKLRRAAKENGARLTIHKSPYLSLFRLSAETEITYETDDTVYLIRLISSQGRKRMIHFANGEYIVSFTRIFYNYAAYGSRNLATLKNAAFTIGDYVNKSVKVRVLPEHKKCDVPYGKDEAEVLLFNPAPASVSRVSAQKSSIEILNVGDKTFGALVFTGSSFIGYANRKKQESARIYDFKSY